MKVIYRPLCGGLAEAMGKVKQFNSIKEMFEFLVEEHNHAFEISNLYISYYGYDNRIDWDTYIITTSRYASEDYIKKGYPPQAAGYCTFKSEN
jgi:hypothetical protein